MHFPLANYVYKLFDYGKKPSNVAKIYTHIHTRFSYNSYFSYTIPEEWENANIHAICKKGDKSLASNYRPISLTSVPCKIMDILFHHIMSHLGPCYMR